MVRLNKHSPYLKGQQKRSLIRQLCNQRERIESSLRSVINACDEAIEASATQNNMVWYEANIIIAVCHALNILKRQQKSYLN